MRQLLSLFLFAFTYFGLHLFIYTSVVRFFSVTSLTAKLALLLSLIALSIGFVGTALLSRLLPNALTACLYRFAAAWVGLFIFLVVTLALAWLTHLILMRFGINAAPLLGAAALALAVIPTGIAAYNALAPTVTDVNVPIRELPPSWENRTVIQLSDVHLGQVQTVDYAEKLVQRVNALNPYVVLITGDLFDGMGSDVAKFMPTLNELRAERGVFFVTGNHEHYLGIEKVLAAMEKSNFRILDKELVELGSVQLVGLSFPGLGGESYPADVITSMPGYDPDKPALLMYHEPVSINHLSNGQNRRSDLYLSPDTD